MQAALNAQFALAHPVSSGEQAHTAQEAHSNTQEPVPLFPTDYQQELLPPHQQHEQGEQGGLFLPEPQQEHISLMQEQHDQQQQPQQQQPDVREGGHSQRRRWGPQLSPSSQYSNFVNSQQADDEDEDDEGGLEGLEAGQQQQQQPLNDEGQQALHDEQVDHNEDLQQNEEQQQHDQDQQDGEQQQNDQGLQQQQGSGDLDNEGSSYYSMNQSFASSGRFLSGFQSGDDGQSGR